MSTYSHRLSLDPPDVPDSIHRGTENKAFLSMALRVRYGQQTHGRASLSRFHLELLKLERAAMQYLSHLNYDERMEFIAGHARLVDVTTRQVESFLNQIGDILMFRELCGIETAILDYTLQETESLRRRSLAPPAKARGGRSRSRK